ncbi:hypothetical protein [Streptomyces sp. NBC_00019]|uniref:hypothetical protein n=1 Tax=Streptomyces sp. NBC_00019 TaxID=2975623 RepID=UPI003249D26B
MELMNSGEYAELPPAQIWARELDDGRYHCSISTMYRILREKGQTGERRRQATHSAKTVPELVATAPSQVFTWDITKAADRPRASGITPTSSSTSSAATSSATPSNSPNRPSGPRS